MAKDWRPDKDVGLSLRNPASAGFFIACRNLIRGMPVLAASSACPVLEPEMDLIRLIFAIILPPVGVFLQVGFGGAFWLNILLTLLGYIPGIIHAVWVIARR